LTTTLTSASLAGKPLDDLAPNGTLVAGDDFCAREAGAETLQRQKSAKNTHPRREKHIRSALRVLSVTVHTPAAAKLTPFDWRQ
jgi:hypothetical protein